MAAAGCYNLLPLLLPRSGLVWFTAEIFLGLDLRFGSTDSLNFRLDLEFMFSKVQFRFRGVWTENQTRNPKKKKAEKADIELEQCKSYSMAHPHLSNGGCHFILRKTHRRLLGVLTFPGDTRFCSRIPQRFRFEPCSNGFSKVCTLLNLELNPRFGPG